MKYIDYKNMKCFYTIEEICRLFEIDKAELKQYSEKYQVHPQEDQYGNWGFGKHMVRKLHNFIYKEQRSQQNRTGKAPWEHSREERRSGPWD